MSRTALITGATGGIGEALCREFAARGYDLIITARSRERLTRQAQRLRRYGVSVQTVAEDLGDPHAPLRLYNQLGSSGVKVDVLVNNAGFGAAGAFARQSAQVQQSMLLVNLHASTRLCRLFLPGMLAGGSGYILNIASTGSFVPGPGNAVYCATKAYLLSLSEALSQEVRGTGVSVTAACPGAVHTGFAHRADMESTLLYGYGVLGPRQVAREAVQAMYQKKPVHVVGAANRTLMFLTRLAPREWTARLSGLVQQQGRRRV